VCSSDLRRYTCPCGCGRNGWFSQPRTLRAAAVSTHPDADAGPA